MAAANTAAWPISDDLDTALARDNRREAAGMHPDERETCWTHQSWAEDCADHLMHTDPHGYVMRQALRTVTS